MKNKLIVLILSMLFLSSGMFAQIIPPNPSLGGNPPNGNYPRIGYHNKDFFGLLREAIAKEEGTRYTVLKLLPVDVDDQRYYDLDHGKQVDFRNSATLKALFDFDPLDSLELAIRIDKELLLQGLGIDPENGDCEDCSIINELITDAYLFGDSLYIEEGGKEWIVNLSDLIPDCDDCDPLNEIDVMEIDTMQQGKICYRLVGADWLCFNVPESTDYTVTAQINTIIVDGQELQECCLYQLGVKSNPIKCDTLSCANTFRVTHNQITIPQTTPVIGSVILSDTLLKIANYFFCDKLIYRDTLPEWRETTCNGDLYCTSTYTTLSSFSDPQCFFISEGDVLTFYGDINIFDSDGCQSANDTNSDIISFNGNPVNSGGGVLDVANGTFAPNSANWFLNLEKPLGFDLIITKLTGGVNMDFYVEQLDGDIGKDVVCIPSCNPATTKASVLSNTNPITGESTIGVNLIKNGAAVALGECGTITVTDGITDYLVMDKTVGEQLQNFNNYNATYFPNGTEVFQNGSSFTFNKIAFGIDFGLTGDNAKTLCLRYGTGGSCSDNMNPLCPIPSVLNEKACLEPIVFTGADNQGYFKIGEDATYNYIAPFSDDWGCPNTSPLVNINNATLGNVVRVPKSISVAAWNNAPVDVAMANAIITNPIPTNTDVIIKQINYTNGLVKYHNVLSNDFNFNGDLAVKIDGIILSNVEGVPSNTIFSCNAIVDVNAQNRNWFYTGGVYAVESIWFETLDGELFEMDFLIQFIV